MTYQNRYAFAAIFTIHLAHLGALEGLLLMIMGRNADLQVFHIRRLMDSHDTRGKGPPGNYKQALGINGEIKVYTFPRRER